MYQWRKFEFFEEKLAGRCTIPEEVREKKIECCSSGRGKVVIGCNDGSVNLLDRGLKFSYGFQAHSSTVSFLQQLKQRNFLVTVGEDVQIPPQQTMCLKVFDLDKIEPEGSSATSPECIGILRIFTNQFPEAKITSFLVLEEAPPILLIAIGLDNGNIYCIKGDIARERINRFKLQVDISDKNQSSITGLGFRVDGQALQLFAVTPDSVSLFSLQSQPPKGQTLDHIGCGVNGVTMSDRSELIVGRPEAVYFYEVDGRGPCWAFEGEKKLVGWFRGYLLCVIADQRNGKNTFNIYDLKNRLIAHSLVVKDVSHMLCEWGSIILIMDDQSALCIGEKDMESKLDMLFKKNLYTIAINLVQSQQADAAATAEVLRKYGDHLYSKQDYDEAMAQYIHTIGHLEPSYVIQKFLDAQRIYNLTNYLENLHEKGLASKDHTTLLLNCYTKLKDVEKLNVFIKNEDSAGEHKFDVETAIRVCRAANYHEHAMYVARRERKHEWYLKILLEDLGRYDEALQYIASLEPSQAGVTIKEYGKILIAHKPRETIDILMKLCTEDGESLKKRSSNRTYLSMLPSPVDFLNIFIHHPQSLMEFFEKYTDKVTDSPAQVEINNTLLELYLSNDLNFPSMSQVGNGRSNSFVESSQSQPLSPIAGGRRSGSFPTSPEFEFWMVRNPSFPQPNLLSADELFEDGVLLPLHLVSSQSLSLSLSSDPNKKSDPEPSPSEPDPCDGPKLTPNSVESGSSLTSSKRWSIFKKSEKKNVAANQEDRVKEKKKEKKSGNGSTSAELNINIWPFSRSRSAGNAYTRPKMFAGTQPGSRKVNSAPCSRSNSTGESKSRKWPSSPSRAGVHLGRSSPVWQVRRGGSAAKTSETFSRNAEKAARKEPTDNNRSKATATAAASRVRVLNLNVPMCIGYRNHLSCRSDEASAVGVIGNDGGGSSSSSSSGSHVYGNNGDLSSVSNPGNSNTNLFSIRSLFTKKVH